MSVTSTVKFLSPEEILARQSTQTERMKVADAASVFRDRALRLRQLAAGHAMRDYLLFVADLADAQHTTLAESRALTVPTREQLDQAASLGQPPLAPARQPLGQGWQVELQSILRSLVARAPEGAALQAVLKRLQELKPEAVQLQGERLLTGIMLELDMAAAPLLGAALQVHWTRWATQTQAAYEGQAFAMVDDGKVCPCCGSLPVASVLRMGGDEGNSRYLHCALCQTEWHMVRIKCAHCESTKGIHYQELEALPGSAQPTHTVPKGAVRAECCEECGHYLKIMAMDKDPHVDPVADDLASVALDLLVSESGVQRYGLNYFLLWGEPDEDAPQITGGP